MKIGFCGSHRTGKTTLAVEIAKYFGVEFVPLNASMVFKRLGYDVRQSITPKERLDLQYEILNEYKKLTDNYDNLVIDRTPIDMVAYAKYGILEENLQPYIDACRGANKLSMIFYLAPSISFIDDIKSFPIQSVEAIDCKIIDEILHDEKLLLCKNWKNNIISPDIIPVYSVPKQEVDLEKRKFMVCNQVEKLLIDTM